MIVSTLRRIVYATLCFALIAKVATAQQAPLPTKAIDLSAGCSQGCLADSTTFETYTNGTSSLGPQPSNFAIDGNGYITPAPSSVVSIFPPQNALGGGFTIALQMGPMTAANPVETVFTLRAPSGRLLFSLLRDNQGRWYVGKMRDYPSDGPQIYYISKTWDPVSPCIAQTCVRDTIYASFQTNGQIQLDEVAVVSLQGSSTVGDAYNWQSGMLNFGYPLTGFNAGGLVDDPTAPLQQWPLGAITLETLQASRFASPALLNQVTYPQAPIARVAMWSTTGANSVGVLNNANQGIALDQANVNANLSPLPQINPTPANANLNLLPQANWINCGSGSFEQPHNDINSGSQYWPAELPTPCNVPSAPLNPRVATSAAGGAFLFWSPPMFLGKTNPGITPAIQNYQVVTYQDGVPAIFGCATTGTTCTINGLTAQHQYSFAISAQGMGGSTTTTPAVTGFSPAAVVTYVPPPTEPSLPTPPSMPGGVADVRTINTGKLISQMNSPNSGMTVVAADRGYWTSNPENSDPAIRAAFDVGIEVVKIDLRASLDGVLVVSHDLDLSRETTGTGFVDFEPWSTISGFALRDRKGYATDQKMLQFADVLNILKAYSDGAGHGPVIIADIKDQGQAAWNDYLKAVSLISSTLPAAMQPAVLLKMPMASLPSTIDPINAEFLAHPAYGHLVVLVNPADATSGNWMPGSSNFQQLFNLSSPSKLSFVNQFELNIHTFGDGATQFINGGVHPGLLNSFATYYQASSYPEGVSTIENDLGDAHSICCYLPTLPTDLRGDVSFSLNSDSGVNQPNVSLITSSNLAVTLNFLVSAGKRNLTGIH
jgi:Glycerophosphoryl diester phosphodiesterase family